MLLGWHSTFAVLPCALWLPCVFHSLGKEGASRYQLAGPDNVSLSSD